MRKCQKRKLDNIHKKYEKSDRKNLEIEMNCYKMETCNLKQTHSIENFLKYSFLLIVFLNISIFKKINCE